MVKLNIRKGIRLAEGKSVLAVDNEFETGSLTALYGASGNGKTTLLKIIAGLVQPEEGYIEVDGQIWLDTRRGINRVPQKRDVGYMFQEYALFPNMTVRQNLQFAAKPEATRQEITELLSLMQLENLADVRPDRLSGGQQQRAALARTLIRRSPLLLLDEPLSAMGAGQRADLYRQLLNYHKQYQLTTLLVSHDAAEIYQLADEVLQIEQGKVIFKGTPQKLLGSAPDAALQLSAEIVGIFDNRLEVLVHHQIISIPLNQGYGYVWQPGQRVTLLCNPDDLFMRPLF